MAKPPTAAEGVKNDPVHRVAMTLRPFPVLATVLTGIVILLPGCATMGPIQTSGDAASLPPFRTFQIYEEQFVFANEISDAQRERVSKELREAAVSALEARGYREAPEADVLVTLGAISRLTLATDTESASGPLHHVDTSVLDAGRAPSPIPESEMGPSGAGREGDLILYLLDPESKRALWRASSNGAATTPAEALRMARATYAAMTAKLPRAAN